MSESDDQAQGADDEVHRRFREALERKQARVARGRQAQQGNSRGVGRSANDKTKREFRRKSGG